MGYAGRAASMWFMSALAYAVTPIAAVALGASVISASERKWATATLGLARASLALGVGYADYAVFDSGQTRAATANVTVVAVGGVALSLLALATTLCRRRALIKRSAAVPSWLAWTGVALVDLFTGFVLLGTAGVAPLWLELFGIVGLLPVPLVLAVRTWQSATDRRRWLAAAYLLGPVLVLGGLGSVVTQVGLLGIRCIVIAVPVVTLLLLPTPAQRGTRTLGSILGVIALLSQGGFVWHHVERCAGELHSVGAPVNWTSLPVVARGDYNRLGRFSFRWQQTSYKSYPAPYENMEIVDRALCFRGSLSLDGWFGPARVKLTHESAMYRSFDELRLRHDPQRDRYVVSARDWDEGPEELIVAFRRELGTMIRFDSTLSLVTFALAAIAALLGGYGVWRWRSRWGLALLLIGASGPFFYYAAVDVFNPARPGHEIRGGSVFPA
jgi:hypothetical protein